MIIISKRISLIFTWAWFMSNQLLANPDQTPPITESSDELMRCAQGACLIFLLVSLVLVTLGSLRAGRGQMDRRTKKFFILGFLLLPTPAFVFMTWKVEKETKTVAFCQSCHAPMDPFVDDMLNPKSEHLASIHFNNRYIQESQCWTCHSGVGSLGVVNAKRNGLIHLYKYTTKTWEPPIKLYDPYDWNICLSCHATSKLFAAPREDREAHEGVLEEVLAGETTCTECHEMAHPSAKARRP